MPTTLADVASVARQVGHAGKHGGGYYPVADHNFNLDERGYCSKFVRQCYEAAAGKPDHGLAISAGGYFGCCAASTEAALRGYRYQVPQAVPGAILCFNHPASGGICGTCGRRVGHIGIYLGENQFAENTSSTTRGPGTTISALTPDLRARISGRYEPFPREIVRPLKIILLPGSQIISCRPEIEDGVCRVDLRSLAEALGYEVISEHLAEQNKIYLRKGGDNND